MPVKVKFVDDVLVVEAKSSFRKASGPMLRSMVRLPMRSFCKATQDLLIWHWDQAKLAYRSTTSDKVKPILRV